MTIKEKRKLATITLLIAAAITAMIIGGSVLVTVAASATTYEV